MVWLQHQISVGPFPRGFHLVTSNIVEVLSGAPPLSVGLCHIFLLHTSASLTINENADPDVRVDLETSMNAIAPESFPYTHTMEGPDDMPAHVKASLIGSSLTIPVRNQRLVLGTWQGVYLCEHRDRASRRQLVVTVHGERGDS